MPDYIKPNNKIQLRPGTRPAVIEDVWEFCHDSEWVKGGPKPSFTKEVTEWKRVAFTFGFTENGEKFYLRERDMANYRSKNSKLSKRIEMLTGLEPGSKQAQNLKLSELIGEDCLITTEQNGEWVNITAVLPPLIADRPEKYDEQPPRDAPFPEVGKSGAAVKQKLKDALKHPALIESERLAVIKSVTGSEELKSIATPEIAETVLLALQQAIDSANSEVPY